MKLRGFFFCLVVGVAIVSEAKAQETLSFTKDIIPVLRNHCYSCHNVGNPKGGVNLEIYEEEGRVIKDGQFWLKVIDEIKGKAMPPSNKPPLSADEYHTLVEGVNGILIKSLENKTPGKVVIRRLNHTEYHYTVLDLTGISFDAKNRFPSDGSGGGGFDNQGRALFFTPLKMERYFDAAEEIVEALYEDREKWRSAVPIVFRTTLWHRIIDWFRSLFNSDYNPSVRVKEAAEEVIYPFASKAYRRYLKAEEKSKLTKLFEEVYAANANFKNPERFDRSMAEVYKAILIAPSFLYKMEEEPDLDKPVPLNDFEIATRLSYFLWSSMPDEELFQLAAEGKLQSEQVLEQQVERMLDDPKARRFSESFVSQWLGITKLKDPNAPLADTERFPQFTEAIKEAMYKETTAYFHHVLTKSNNFLDLINSNYTFVNEDLADFYGLNDVTGNDFQLVHFTDGTRGGLLGMGSVLTVTSLPTRTSPVLRGKWVMEEILGISPPPPPPDVSELPEDDGLHEDLGLRALLERHRSDPACQSCHEKMDPLGIGLENFDAVGKWRESYGNIPIDPSGVLSTGETFAGPSELKKLLLAEREKFARNLSSRFLSYAVGRSVLFSDEIAIRDLTENLLTHDFHPKYFISELVKSYSFRMKIKDFQKRSTEI
ncbi:hypothetical protein ADIS_3259 [Lunatimonas lonarensis]|uniref:DUF1592 domain-containing protein n=1 Tax=Lunatimonas lonarensis TaxID=1232681 RepID=R7ZPT3_9BACT|nr:DUF1592 domain-containing protein [Lunatimonas lonarensis]EON76131.1 hypothetical protein ADIS_3259 [Lunatimonas lonarensis]